MRRILLEDEKPPKAPRPIRLKHRQRYCFICDKWYRCPNDKVAKNHEEGIAHLRHRKRLMGY